MHNFKKIIFNAIPFIAIFAIIESLISFALVPQTSYTRIAIHEMYTYKSNYDIIFIGASHAYRSFDTRIVDEILEVNSFNAGSSSQSIKGMYFYLKEILRIHEPKQVVIELSYPFFVNQAEPNNILNEIILFDYFNLGINKLKYFCAAFSVEDIGNVFFKSYRYRSNLQMQVMIQNVKDKSNMNYWRYEPLILSYGYYVKNGFVFSNEIWKYEEKFEEYTKWSVDNLFDESFVYLKKVIELCKANNIEVQIVTAPMPIETLTSQQNYDEIHSFFEQYLYKNYGLEYYDFNYVRPSEMNRSYLFFQDNNHLNGTGAQIFTQLYANAQKDDSMKALLCDSIKELTL